MRWNVLINRDRTADGRPTMPGLDADVESAVRMANHGNRFRDLSELAEMRIEPAFRKFHHQIRALPAEFTPEHSFKFLLQSRAFHRHRLDSDRHLRTVTGNAGQMLVCALSVGHLQCAVFSQ